MSFGSFLHTNLWKSRSLVTISIARYILLISAVRAIRCWRNLIKTSIRGWTVGPTISVSLNDTPVEDLADVSNTARALVVVCFLCIQHALASRKLGERVSVSHQLELARHDPFRNILRSHLRMPWVDSSSEGIVRGRETFSQLGFMIHLKPLQVCMGEAQQMCHPLTCDGFHGSGMTKCSSGEQEPRGWFLGVSSTSQNLLSNSSPDTVEAWLMVTQWLQNEVELVLPVSTQPTLVSNATGASGGPVHRPCNPMLA